MLTAAHLRPHRLVTSHHLLPVLSLALAFGLATCSRTAEMPLLRTLDLETGETQQVELSDGKRVEVKLLGVEATRDTVREAIRSSRALVEVNGDPVTLECANYRLPLTHAGVRIDCTVTSLYMENNRRDRDPWALRKDARLRLWPADSPLLKPGTFVYPVRQRWFASGTQMANEPTHVDGGEAPSAHDVYYHNGLDIGGAEALVEVVAATDGLLVSRGEEVLDPTAEDTPVDLRYDVIYILDERGWYYRYSHLYSFAEEVKLGDRVRMGQKIGLLGKEGGSGGWTHLHFEIKSRQPSGYWGTEEGYAFLWEAYLQEFDPEIVAVARPHHFVWVGEKVTLDGSRSWSRAGEIAGYEWTFTGGGSASGPTVERIYEKAGMFSEVLKVTDAAGHASYDFAVVQVVERQDPDPDTERVPPTIHPTFHPTTNLRPGDPVTFQVRTFRTTAGKEKWDFGDGSPPVMVQSDGNVETHAKDGYAVTTHSFSESGDYLVSVERTNERGETAVARLLVRVGEGD